MLNVGRKIYPLYFLIDITLIVISFLLPYVYRYHVQFDGKGFAQFPYIKDYFFMFVLWGLFVVFFLKRHSLHMTDRSLTISKEMWRVIISVVYASLLVALIIFFAHYTFFSRFVFVSSFFLLCIFLSSWRIGKRLFVRHLISRGYHNTNILLVGAGRVAKGVCEEVKKHPWWGFNVVGFLDDRVKSNVDDVAVIGCLSDFADVVKRYFVEEAIVTIPSERERVAELMKEARRLHVSVRLVPENFEGAIPTISVSKLGIIPLITYQEIVKDSIGIAVKYMLDFLGAFVLVIVGMPVLIIIAICIRVDSPGAIMYTQKRVGRKGRVFNFLKFRSMIANADELKNSLKNKNEVADGVIFKMKNDPRVTRVGRFLRKYSLDELPQLFNVLKGDMSLVGPRPPVPSEVVQYSHDDMVRLSIRPGMTGVSQVKGRSTLSFRNWVRWDIWYVHNWSLLLDLKILWWTIPAVLKAKGAY